MGTVRDAVVLAAGGGQRMGLPKARLLVDGVPLLLQHVERFQGAGLVVTAVLGADFDDIAALLPRTVRVVRNPRWAETDPAHSAWLALQDLGDCLLAPVDTPPASPGTLQRLLRADGDAVPSFDGHDGHPVRLCAPHRPGRLDERLAGAPRLAVDDPACVLNLNTPADLATWRAVRPRP